MNSAALLADLAGCLDAYCDLQSPRGKLCQMPGAQVASTYLTRLHGHTPAEAAEMALGIRGMSKDSLPLLVEALVAAGVPQDKIPQ